MNLLVILLIIVLLGGIGTGPWMPYASTWGWGGPSIGLVLIIVLVVLLLRGGL